MMETGALERVDPRKILAGLAGTWFFLWSASVAQDLIIWSTNVGGKIWLLDVDNERSFYTWFSTLLLGFVAFLALLLASHRDATGPDFRSHWRAIGALFLILSMDEMVSLHEKLSAFLSSQIDTSGVFTFAWVLVALPLVLVLGVTFWRFILQLPRRISLTVGLAAVIFLTGAVGMEMIAGLFLSEQASEAVGVGSPVYRVMTNIEEGLEAIGLMIFIRALLIQSANSFPHFFVEQLELGQGVARSMADHAGPAFPMTFPKRSI